jgi:hypothetical protein
MPRFAVHATEVVIQYITFYVEANDEDEARDKVIDGDFEDSIITGYYDDSPLDIHVVKEV